MVVPIPKKTGNLSKVNLPASTSSLALEFLFLLCSFFGCSTNVGLTANPIVNFSGVVGINALAIGADVLFNTKPGELTKLNDGVNFTKDGLVASLTVNDRGNALNAAYFHVVSPLSSTAIGKRNSVQTYKLQDFLSRLEEEQLKMDAFKRELSSLHATSH
ncbi:unnamed protein product [Lupinus luteus]|uniref:HHO5-like N-terminal domain-containing protein n=1 Tax=Lupinus luteus TaxID=3873 RepID=A0AAV1XQY0_LUPLU